MAKRNSQFVYRHNVYSSAGGYLHLTIEVLRKDRCSADSLVTMTWQSNREGGQWEPWYAFKLNLEANHPDQLAERSRLARRILKDCNWDTSPADIVERLHQMGIKQAVYDLRVGEFVYASEILPPEVRSWRDDWRALGRSSCTVGCLAVTEDEAKAKIAQKLAANPRYDKLLVEFIQAGRPVYLTDDRAPEFVPVSDVLDPNRAAEISGWRF